MKKIIKRLKINDLDVISLIKGGGVNFIFYGLNLSIVYLLAIIITKYYGAATYGRYSIIKSLILVLIIIISLGLNTNAIKLGSNKNHYYDRIFKSNFLKKSYFILLITSLITSISIFYFKEEIAIGFFDDKGLVLYLTYFPLILIVAVFLNYNSNLLKGNGRVFLFSLVSSFLNNILFISLIFVFFNWYSTSEFFLILALLISFIIAFLFSSYKIFPIKYNTEILNISYKKLLKDSFPMMLSSSMIFIIFSADTLMLGYFGSSENVGIYRVITQISGLNAVFLIILGTVVGPKISKLSSEGRSYEIKTLVYKSSKLIFFISLPILIITLVFSNQILLFFGKEYLKGSAAIIILSICQFLYAISGLVDLILNMTGRQKAFGKITVVTAFLNIALNIFLIPKYGITGAAIATGFSILLTNALGLIYIYKNLNFLSLYLPKLKAK